MKHLQALIKDKKKQLLREKLSENTEKPNELWKIMKINRLTKQKGYYNKHMAQYKKELIFSPRTIAKTFQKQFANLASKSCKQHC